MKRHNRFTPRVSRKGFAAIYLVFAFLMLIPVVGLAIDFSILYNIKGRLQAACDAAAIAGGNLMQRSVSVTDSATIAAIQATAQRYFNANFQAGQWGTRQASYSATPTEDVNTKIRTIVVTASETVPALFLRVLGITGSTVGSTATVKVRYTTMMIAVDRSGSVGRGGSAGPIEDALTTFVANQATSYLVDGRDVVGMVSFGGTYSMDLSPTMYFRSGSPGMTSVISTLDGEFGNSATNTAEALYQSYHQLQLLNNVGALNVIVLLTDGRPSAFTVTTSLSCHSGSNTGFISAIVASDASWPPPTNYGGYQGGSQIYPFGWGKVVFNDTNGWGGGDLYPVTPNSGCSYPSDPETVNSDMPNFPTQDSHGNNTQTGYYPLSDRSVSNPQDVRYASFNTADNMATTIRTDTVIRPVLFVIGLNEPASAGEPLDADWLARVANDPDYLDGNGHHVYQNGQTKGMYFNVTASGLQAAFHSIASQCMRLSQ